MIGYESLGQIIQKRQTLLTDGVPVVRVASWLTETEDLRASQWGVLSEQSQVLQS